MPRSHTHRRLIAAVAGLSGALAFSAGPAQAAGPEVVASGLRSPRLLTVSPTGDIYVAEAGSGGDVSCAEHPEFGRACFGYTGAITRVNPSGPDDRVVTGLPSVSAGEDAIGPADVEFTGGNTYVVSIGLGADPELREEFGEGGALLGTLLTGKLKQTGFRVLADVAANEAASNPDRTDLDSNPVGILRSGASYYVADAGGNALVKASHNGAFSTTAVLPPVPTTRPVDLGGGVTLPVGFPADAVPTAVVRGPDRALYVSQLTGFPFEAGASSIWRVSPGGQLTKWATGLTNVTDLTFAPDGSLYAVQIAANGLFAGPIGSLVKVTPGASSHTTVAGGMFAPYGVAITKGSAYVSTCSVCTQGGQVVRIPL